MQNLVCSELPLLHRVAKRTSRPSIVAPDAWVNWSGLATQLANLEKAFAGKLNHFFLLFG